MCVCVCVCVCVRVCVQASSHCLTEMICAADRLFKVSGHSDKCFNNMAC